MSLDSLHHSSLLSLAPSLSYSTQFRFIVLLVYHHSLPRWFTQHLKVLPNHSSTLFICPLIEPTADSWHRFRFCLSSFHLIDVSIHWIIYLFFSFRLLTEFFSCKLFTESWLLFTLLFMFTVVLNFSSNSCLTFFPPPYYLIHPWLSLIVLTLTSGPFLSHSTSVTTQHIPYNYTILTHITSELQICSPM